MRNFKQVILIRRDLKMRRGKEIAQGSHASMAFLVERIRSSGLQDGRAQIALSDAENEWICHGMAKICLQVSSEEELKSLFNKSRDAGLEAQLIRDSGKTEFGGVPTLTALAIGPALAESIDAVTGHLPLY
jgi:PTH2 family peptidyl-tRNA hydrolase